MAHIDIRFHFDESKEELEEEDGVFTHTFYDLSGFTRLDVEGIPDDEIYGILEILGQSDDWHIDSSWKILEAMDADKRIDLR